MELQVNEDGYILTKIAKGVLHKEKLKLYPIPHGKEKHQSTNKKDKNG
jgi:hypothetical protein